MNLAIDKACSLVTNILAELAATSTAEQKAKLNTIDTITLIDISLDLLANSS